MKIAIAATASEPDAQITPGRGGHGLPAAASRARILIHHLRQIMVTGRGFALSTVAGQRSCDHGCFQQGRTGI